MHTLAGKSLKPLWITLASRKLLQKGPLGAKVLLSLVPPGTARMLTAREALCRWLDTFLGHSLVLKSFPAELLGPGFLCKTNRSMVEMSQDAACVCKAEDPSEDVPGRWEIHEGSALVCIGLAHV